ncbi:hypothetical protein Tsubulata_010081 [Turnera subulata]|uniref:J domain-containing protein n=1 Tax=Turnera subulata TaxID=218843 RepID=A0A9Q0FAN2_9ROSI|nr:hypothetical protein Tsubulata_010081 [Turnera subulata]
MYSLASSSSSSVFISSASQLRLAPRRSMSVRASSSYSTFSAEPIALNCAGGGKAPSLYEILRVKETASEREIRTAYRSLAKRYHPDAGRKSDGRDFIEIHNAYETLSDPAARAVYDLSLLSAVAARSYYQRRRERRSSGFSPTRRWETDQCW